MVTVLCITFFVIQHLSSAKEMGDRTVPVSTARNLRFTAGNLMYQSGMIDVPQLQTILGYKNTSFASKYSLPNGMAARKAMEAFKIKEELSGGSI